MGLTWAGYRPSDDACQYHYLVPSNAFLYVALGNTQEMLGDYSRDFESFLRVSCRNPLPAALTARQARETLKAIESWIRGCSGTCLTSQSKTSSFRGVSRSYAETLTMASTSSLWCTTQLTAASMHTRWTAEETRSCVKQKGAIICLKAGYV